MEIIASSSIATAAHIGGLLSGFYWGSFSRFTIAFSEEQIYWASQLRPGRKIVTLEQALFDLLDTPPDTIEELIGRMSPEIYERLKEAVSLGRFNEQERMGKEQLGQCMQLLILYEAHHLESHERTGSPLQADCQSERAYSQTIRLMQAPQENKH